MKKKIIIGLLLFSFLGNMCFAQNANGLLLKAKEYEKQKKYFHALGTYYDLIATAPSREILDSYKKLKLTIQEGNPGVGTYNEFTLHDAWLDLLRDYEQYWTEFPGEVFLIQFGEAERKALDYATKKAEYSIRLGISKKSPFTDKFVELTQIVCEGLKQVRKKDWKDIPECYSFKNSFDYSWDSYISYFPFASVEKSNSLEKTGIANINGCGGGAFKHYSESDAFLASWISGHPIWFWWDDCIGCSGRVTMIKVLISIFDKNAKLLDSKLINLNFDGNEIKFSVSADVMDTIDSGEYEIRITDAFLLYGCVLTGNSKKDFEILLTTHYSSGAGYFIDKMPTKKIPVEQFYINDKCKNFNRRINNWKSLEDQIVENEDDMGMFDHVMSFVVRDEKQKPLKIITVYNVPKVSFKKLTGKNFSDSFLERLYKANGSLCTLKGKDFKVLTSGEWESLQDKAVSKNASSIVLQRCGNTPFIHIVDCDSACLVWSEKEILD